VDAPGDGSTTVWLEPLTSVSPAALRPTGLSLGSAYPNPFNPGTTVDFSLANAQAVRLTVHNALGQTVAVLHDGPLAAGQHSRGWNAGNLASGVYYARLEGQGQSLVTALTLVK
jgi:hypothetical protein